MPGPAHLSCPADVGLRGGVHIGCRHTVQVDGRRAVVPHPLGTTFEELRAGPPEGCSFGWIGLQDDIDGIEVQVLRGDPDVSRRIHTLTREVVEFQRAVEPLGRAADEVDHHDDRGQQEPQRDEEPPRVQPLSALKRSARSGHGGSLTHTSSHHSPPVGS